MRETQICQSCGMPMEKTEDFETNVINSLKIITTLIYKIPPTLPFPKGGI
jgi:hypothetical protein